MIHQSLLCLASSVAYGAGERLYFLRRQIWDVFPSKYILPLPTLRSLSRPCIMPQLVPFP